MAESSLWGPSEKRCCACRNVFPIDNFYRYRKGGHRRHPYCRTCALKKIAANHKKRKEHGKTALYEKKRAHLRRDLILQRTYGLSQNEFNEILAKQGGACAICGKPESALNKFGNIKHLSIDHNHTTGKVRALLCARCNLAIGLLMEDVALFEKAIAYLNSFANR